jgi:transcriptional regulator GlxA family with amidase domain
MLQRVAAIAVNGVSAFELGLVCEVFGIDRADTGGPTFDFTLCTPEPGRVAMEPALAVEVLAGMEVAADADLVVMLPYKAPYTLPDEARDALRAAHARGAWVMSICSGTFALGEAGLLDGRRCTTHWMYADDLQHRYPTAQVDPAVLYVEDRGVISSAGTAAGIDACLHLVRRELGAQQAAAVARRMVVPPHRDGGQAQYVDTPLPCDADTLAPLLAWMTEHLDTELTVPDLAARALMSERTFARRFRAETGTTPAAWVTRQRLVRAQEMLERTSVGVDEIARASGFGSAAILRHHFSRVLGTNPQAYRRQFACTDEAQEAAAASVA